MWCLPPFVAAALVYFGASEPRARTWLAGSAAGMTVAYFPVVMCTLFYLSGGVNM